MFRLAPGAPEGKAGRVMSDEQQPPPERQIVRDGAVRDGRAVRWVESIWRDLRISFRGLRRSAAFSVAVVLTLALCIWANTTVLSVLYGLVLKPLPFPDAGQVVEVYNMRPKAGQMHQNVGLGQYLDYKDHADLFSGFALWMGWMFNIGEEGGTVRYVGMQATPEFFSVLGVQPLLGRFFAADECRPGQDAVTVLTQSFWEKEFHADPDIVGKVVRLTGRPYTIIGVAPRSFEDLNGAALLITPYAWTPDQAQPQFRLAPMGTIYARIKPGVSHGEALAQLQTLEGRFRESLANPAMREFLYRGGHRMGLGQVKAEMAKPIEHSLILLQGGALLVLLLGCVNVASLMLARANARRTELAVRQALGASRGVLARQLLTEAAVLAVAGGALGLLLTAPILGVINAYLNQIVYGMPPVGLDGGVLGLTLLVSLVVALLIGALPVMGIWRGDDLQGAIQSGMRGASRGGGIRAMSGVLVVAQVALAIILLIGAGLLIRSFAKVMAIDPGFDVDKVIYARVAYDSTYQDPAILQGLQNRFLEKMREIPGVESVAYSSYLPGHIGLKPTTLPIRGMPTGQDSTYPTAILFGVSPEYFSTMGIRLLEGRNFTTADHLPGARPVAIVDRKFAERYFPDRSAVGQLFSIGPNAQDPNKAPMIVGVVAVARVDGLEDRDSEPYVYWAVDATRGGLSIEFRTRRRFEDLMPQVRAQVRSVDPTLPIYGETTMRKDLDDKEADRRGILWLLGAYATIALILAAVGIYGMLAYDVTQRTKEIGIRGAIGATREQIVELILRQGMLKAGLGMVIGLSGAFGLSRFMASLLYEVEPRDPLVFTGVALLLMLVALLASWLPARRAAKVDPMVALRCE
ncbi:MAG: ABC transporter permease [Opitutales bacterium]